MCSLALSPSRPPTTGVLAATKANQLQPKAEAAQPEVGRVPGQRAAGDKRRRRQAHESGQDSRRPRRRWRRKFNWRSGNLYAAGSGRRALVALSRPRTTAAAAAAGAGKPAPRLAAFYAAKLRENERALGVVVPRLRVENKVEICDVELRHLEQGFQGGDEEEEDPEELDSGESEAEEEEALGAANSDEPEAEAAEEREQEADLEAAEEQEPAGRSSFSPADEEQEGGDEAENNDDEGEEEEDDDSTNGPQRQQRRRQTSRRSAPSGARKETADEGPFQVSWIDRVGGEIAIEARDGQSINCERQRNYTLSLRAIGCNGLRSNR